VIVTPGLNVHLNSGRTVYCKTNVLFFVSTSDKTLSRWFFNRNKCVADVGSLPFSGSSRKCRSLFSLAVYGREDESSMIESNARSVMTVMRIVRTPRPEETNSSRIFMSFPVVVLSFAPAFNRRHFPRSVALNKKRWIKFRT